MSLTLLACPCTLVVKTLKKTASERLRLIKGSPRLIGDKFCNTVNLQNNRNQMLKFKHLNSSLGEQFYFDKNTVLH